MEFPPYLDKINDMINHAHKNIVCGTECKRKKKAYELKKIYNNAKNNNESAPEELEQAKKNYFVYTKGKDFYQSLKDKEYDDKRDSLISSYLKERTDKTLELNAIIDNYNIFDYYNKNVDDYLEDQINEYDELKSGKENTIGKSLTNDRRTYYSGLSNKNILKINNVIKILYIALLVLYSILILFYRRLMINYNYIIIPILLIAYILINNILHVSSKSYQLLPR